MRSRYIRIFSSLQATIALTIFSLVFVAVLVVEVIAYHLTEQTVASDSKSYTLQLIEAAGQNIDSYITYMKNISSVIMYDREVERYFAQPVPRERAQITGLLDAIKRTRRDINLIAVFGLNGKVISDRSHLDLNPYVKPENLLWYRAALRAHGEPVISSSHVQFVLKKQHPWVITLSREILDHKTGKPIAVLLVDLNFSVIRDICTTIDLGRRGYVFIVDSGGTIIYHPQQQLIYSNLKKERIDEVLTTKGSSFVAGIGKDRRIYTINTSSDSGWRIVGVTYMSSLVSDEHLVQIYYLLLGVACFTVVVLLSLLVSFRISRPIRMLTRSVQQVERGNFDIQVQVSTPDEIGNLGAKFNLMIAKIRELMRQNEREHEAKRRAELQALQAQINPHFLYNTLDSIIWMAEARKHREVVQMVSSLAKLLRLTISSEGEIVTIQEEVDQITNYLIIQKMRYRDRLDFLVDVQDTIRRNRILKILLQPLVENSIYHGIKNRDGPGMVQVLGRRVGSRILIQIVDNGVGADPEQMKAILASDGHMPDGGHSKGVGVRNVHERIKLYFGEDYGLDYSRGTPCGTTVDVWLPAL